MSTAASIMHDFGVHKTNDRDDEHLDEQSQYVLQVDRFACRGRTSKSHRLWIITSGSGIDDVREEALLHGAS